MSVLTSRSTSPELHLFAGAVSGLIACVTLQPLDLLKTRVQQQHSQDKSMFNLIRSTVKSDGGILQLWRGTFATILRNVPGSGLYFLVLNETRTRMKGVIDKDLLNLVSGMSSRVAVGSILMPITVVKVRFEVTLKGYNLRATCIKIRLSFHL